VRETVDPKKDADL